jgi:RHS repeat-associated protein
MQNARQPYLTDSDIMELHYGPQDHLGSTRAVIQREGASVKVVEAMMYQAYGKIVRLAIQPDSVRMTFTTKEFDNESGMGLYYFGARYYDPEVGSFTSVDPADVFWNTYSYCGADPINIIDPDGTEPYTDDEGNTYDYEGEAVAQSYTFDPFVIEDGGFEYYDGGGEIGVGAPGLWESFIPIWGSGRAAINDYQNGHPVWGTINTALAVTDVFLVKALVKGLITGGGKVALEGICFPESTLVFTSTGYKDIRFIAAGDSVLTKDENSGNEGFRKVTQTFVTIDQSVVELRFTLNGAIEQIVQATPEHPFYVKNRGWIKAISLVKDDTVMCSGGEVLLVEQVSPLMGSKTVYNFNVDGTHSYFVGKEKIWVHNSCRQLASPIFKTNTEAAKAAARLGFEKTNFRSMGQAVFKKDNYYLTRDLTGHNGGAWKMARSVEDLGSRTTRMGTYDVNLIRIGD